MTHIKQAIKEAVEKGSYKGAKSVEWPPLDYGSVLFTLKTGGKLHYWWSQIFLDPSFWKALGKARGWKNYERADKSEKWIEWQKVWHRFIDHLAEWKDAESFFATLI